MAAILIRRARKLYVNDDIGLDLENTVYALDSTTIDLCLSLFPWADFRSTKAAVKMHTLLAPLGRSAQPQYAHVILRLSLAHVSTMVSVLRERRPFRFHLLALTISARNIFLASFAIALCVCRCAILMTWLQ